jgi:hypothetical protein
MAWRRPLQMIIIDDFVKDEKLINKMKDLDGDFWKIGYHWWGGWWNSNSPMTLRHELIEYIWRDGCPPQLHGVGIGGFEHWTGILSKDIKIGNEDGYALNHHHDKDEGGGKDKPKLGTVYYPPMEQPQCEGGYLKIYSKNHRNAPYELIAPVPNRLIIFDATQLHAVTEIPKGHRFAIAINLWDKKPTTMMVED